LDEEAELRFVLFQPAAGQGRHGGVVYRVQQMLKLQQELDAARTDQDKKHLQRLIDATDHQIDRLVYELYGLSHEEIAIVNGDPPAPVPTTTD
jgi:hypothetical protein